MNRDLRLLIVGVDRLLILSAIESRLGLLSNSSVSSKLSPELGANPSASLNRLCSNGENVFEPSGIT